ncbi:MAG: hypothetical protein IT427_02875 [Pirellulales bacterium]|nr:hypothetical protein [Pirellulales bacterium]
MALDIHKLRGIPQDTTLEAFRVQCDIFSRLSSTERLRRTFDLIDFAERLSAAGIRQRHPDYTEEQVRMALARMRLGDEVFQQVYPRVEVAL